ncbi:CDF family Co(II)/Ni(II) efflux transporter DmeF [Photobacterium lutimaris]|uniref:Cation transporter n=1 Tax=Photobacterium lutimaris TaxID=388278 RepID=A0A2T3IVT2_9GAMM|nr:CDF family Co(II)/Ni(II) efflux transporter DmeF [Photobacterium lutimaris]PSU32543.1 cation transporter [Photobacterium lutimaris]TDR77753.1 cation diffusion facilitator family transporter [Photobacterium lutimaris]
MHSSNLQHWQHSHDFASINPQGEKRTLWVLGLTAITMVAEITAGTLFGSMALLADGWHMGTHAAAFLITVFAYRYARKHANNPAFSFGTGKVSVLGGFTSAIALGLVALLMLVESFHRLLDPQAIQFNEAIFVAVIGLVVNIVSVFLLHGNHHDDHGHHHHNHAHEHGHNHEHHHGHDHNLRAAYFHVLADALTSLLAIVALLFGKYLGYDWLDAVMGMVGAVIITRWAWGLMKQTSPILLDGNIDHGYQQIIIDTLESDADSKVSDIHIWKVSADHYAAMISLVTHQPKAANEYKQLLKEFDKLSHLTIEVNPCRGAH